MAAALMRRVISTALLSSSPRPVRKFSQLLCTRIYRTSSTHDENVAEIDDRIVFYSNPRNIISKDTAEGVYLSMEMPGVNKEDIKVCVEQGHLIIKGILKKEALDNGLAVYYHKADLTEFAKTRCFKFDEIKAEMKSGVVQVLIPLNKEVAKKIGLVLPLPKCSCNG